jgi:hypothetical protein
MMNAGELLVPAVDEIAAAALCTMSATAPEGADADTLPERPALDVIADRIDHAYRLMARHARPLDWEGFFDRRRVGVADAASLDAKADLPRGGIDKRLLRQFELSRPDGLDGGVCCRMVRHESSSV